MHFSIHLVFKGLEESRNIFTRSHELLLNTAERKTLHKKHEPVQEKGDLRIR
jgi:hypothetical protein